jgi:hypothetical protein
VRLCILVFAVCVVTAYGSAQPEPGFDPQAVVRQVQAGRDMPGLQPGGHGRIRGRPASRFPEFAELGVEQFPDNGEFLLDTNNAMVPAPGSQTEAAVGYDGTNFLVVWQDQRGGNYSDICGARVTPDGTVLDPMGFVISQAAYDQRNPALAFDGANFLVVWDDYRRGHAYDIYGTRVTTGGAVLDAFGIIISDAMNDQQCPAVAFDSANFLVVWQDNVYDVQQQDISGARVTQGGAVLDPDGFVISQAAQDQYTPVIGFDGSNYLVAWTDCRATPAQADIYGARVTPGGAVLDPQGFAIGNLPWAQWSPALAFDGANFLVAWQDINSGHTPPVIGVWGARVTPGGTVLEPSGIAIADGTGGSRPAVGFDGTDFLVAWHEVHGFPVAYSSIWGARVTPEGTVLDTAAIVVSPAARWSRQSPSVGLAGANFLVIWQDDRNAYGEPDIYGARVTPAGAVLDSSGLLITLSARGQYSPVIGYDGANFLVVWEDDRSGYTDIYGARVTPSGTVLDSTGIVIAQAPEWQYEPAIAFDGANFLVAWQDYRSGSGEPDIYGARVSPSGAVLDPGGIAISDAPNRQYFPAIAYGGGCYLVLWQDFRNGSYDIYATMVAPDGTVLSTDGFVITQASNWQCNPALGFDGTNFLAVWEDYRNTPGLPDIYGTRVRPDGTVLEPDGIAVTRAANGQHNPTLDFDGTNYLVVWDDGRTSAWPDIYGARVTTGGTVLDTSGIAVSRGSKDQFAPALAFDGTNYLAVWEDYRGSNNPDIYGAWVSPAGVVSDEGSVLRPPGNQTCLALARGSGSQLFMAFQGWAGIVGGKTYNTDRIWGEMNPTPGGGIEETMNDERVSMNVGPTIVRGVLFLPSSLLPPPFSLLSIDGRKVMDLKPGANDVRALAPGVYFVRETQAQAQAQAVRKIVLTR